MPYRLIFFPLLKTMFGVFRMYLSYEQHFLRKISFILHDYYFVIP